MTFLKKYPKIWMHTLSSLLMGILMIFIFLTQEDYYQKTDSILRDYIFKFRGEQPSSGNVVIVDIDEKSLQKYGQWPWPRDIVAKLIQNIMSSGAYVVGLDMVFAEADSHSPSLMAEKLHINKSKLANYDEILADVFASYPGQIVGGIFLTNDRKAQKFEDSSQSESTIYIEHGSKDHILTFKSTTLNVKTLQDKLYSNGFLNTLPDSDGTVRSVPIVMKSSATGIYPSLALEMYKVYLGKSGKDVTVTIEGTDSGLDGIFIDNSLYIPTDRFGRILVNYRGKRKTFTYVSAADVLEMNEKAKALKETFVLVGTSAIGLFDMRPTPFDSTMPGVEIHATVLDNFLMEDFITSSQDSEIMVITLVLTIIFFSVLLFTLSNEYLKIPLFIAMLYALYYLNFMLLFKYHFIINIVIPLFSLILSFIITITIDFIVTSSQKKIIINAFAKKVSPDVMDDLILHNAKGLLEPVEREVSIFFSDIRSFTTISEEIGSPKRLIALLNRYMTPMVDIIIDEKGTVDKFIGDAIMAYWNAPVEIKNHADNAVKSAIFQIQTLQKIRGDIKKEYGIVLNIGIGINTGIATIGDMGSEGRSDYTIIGDHVNLASRLEGLTKNYGVQIIISSYTKEKLTEFYKLRSLDFVKVKGKHEAVEIFEVVVNETITLEEIERYNQAITLYRDTHIKSALKEFEELEKKDSSLLYKTYIQRCKHYIDHPEIEFDVTLTMTTK